MPSRCLPQPSRILLVLLLCLAGVSGPLSSAALVQSCVFGIGSYAATGAAPGAIVAADFNLDGKLDLSVANQNEASPASVKLHGANAATLKVTVIPTTASTLHPSRQHGRPHHFNSIFPLLFEQNLLFA